METERDTSHEVSQPRRAILSVAVVAVIQGFAQDLRLLKLYKVFRESRPSALSIGSSVSAIASAS